MRRALEAAGASLADIAAFDLYSCFPIAVFNICDALGLAPDDPRGLTVTGGLPFFGGAGNNYSMHAIASMVAQAAPRMPGALGLVGANGGFLTKYSVGVYSTAAGGVARLRHRAAAARGRRLGRARRWRPTIRARPRSRPTRSTMPGKTPRGVVVGRTPAGARFAAAAEDDAIVRRLIDEEPLGGRIAVAHQDDGRILVTAFEPALATA